MSRVQALSTRNAGMTRLRHKGGAAPDSLYDCLNCYPTLAGTIKPRPSTVVDHVLPAGTKGLTSHKGKLYVFSEVPVTMTDPDYVNAVLRHPTDDTIALSKIHFAAPFMGFLYVAAEFADGNTWHFWLEELDAWSSGTSYDEGDRVVPSTQNGFAYKSTRLYAPAPQWAPNVERSLNDVIEPTVYNGFKYQAVAVSGDLPASGETEPEWPTNEGEQVTEVTYGEPEVQPEPGPPAPPGGEIPPRYRSPNLPGWPFFGFF